MVYSEMLNDRHQILYSTKGKHDALHRQRVFCFIATKSRREIKIECFMRSTTTSLSRIYMNGQIVGLEFSKFLMNKDFEMETFEAAFARRALD